MDRRQMLGGLCVMGAAGALGGLSWLRGQRPALLQSPCPGMSGNSVRWIVPHAPGGGYDAESRLLQPFLEHRLGMEIAIENTAGAGGLIGARALASATPDGLTLGILGMPGLLVAAAIGEAGLPDPGSYTLLGRISRSWHVWATAPRSGIRNLDDARIAAKRKPLVAGVSEVASVNFTSLTVSAAILDVPVTLVAGFDGSRSATLAAIRGDVDLVCFNFETIRESLVGGELRALLQVSDRRIDSHSALDGVPILGGDGGIATGQMTSGLIEVIASGRVVAAPPAMDATLAACLGGAVYEALNSPELKSRSRRPLDIGTGAEALRDVQAAARDLAALLPPLRNALRAVRAS